MSLMQTLCLRLLRKELIHSLAVPRILHFSSLVASTFTIPCRYQTTGCQVVLHHSEKGDHEEGCEFRPYRCPCPDVFCEWRGMLEAVMPHLVTSHVSISMQQGEHIMFLAKDIGLPTNLTWVMIQACFGHHFMLIMEKQEKFDGHQQFFAMVQLIGSRNQAEGFTYHMELNRQRRRLMWKATPRSIHEGVASVILNSDCLIFDTCIAQQFADNGNLCINVTISIV